MSKSAKIILLILLILVIDQSLKIWVKTSMEYGEEISILGLNWAKLHFVENNGMAFGISLGGGYGKLILSLFRIAAVIGLGYFINMLIKSKVSFGLLISFALILAGAIGNIIDSAVYGLIFSGSSYHGGLATMFPEGGGYSSFLHGKVVDMFYFPLFQGVFPDWIPYFGGNPYLFFRPVFNVADVSISVGVISILLFHRSFFKTEEENKNEDSTTENDPTIESVIAEKTTTETIETENLENTTNQTPENKPNIDDLSSKQKIEGND